jgi:hypothetical protein
MIEKLAAILDVPQDPIKEADLLRFEQDHGMVLPPDYRTFLQHFDGGAVVDMDITFFIQFGYQYHKTGQYLLYYVLPLQQSSGYGSVEEMIDVARSWYLEDLNVGYDYTRDFITIALTGGNVHVCLGCSEKYYGKVYLLDFFTSESGSVQGHFLPLADSFTAFVLDVLQPADEMSARMLTERLASSAT